MERVPTIYFARVGQDGPIKIGFTTGLPAERIAALQTGCPWPINLIAQRPGCLSDEARFHAMFIDTRIAGEWFAADERLLQVVDEVREGIFMWPPDPVIESPAASQITEAGDRPTVASIIKAAGGVNAIAAASRGELTIDAVHKWRRNGIRDWHWPLLMSLCDVTPDQLLQANERQRANVTVLRVA